MSSKKNSHFIYIIIIVIIFIAIGLFIFFQNRNYSIPENSINNTTRLATEDNSSDSSEQLANINNRINDVISENTKKEEEISSFFTSLSGSSEGRLTNIRVSCDILNETIVSSGETFSFCDTVGPSTEEKGYKEAPVIEHGKTVQALGGGNCQISSTLYNAVLKIDDFTVVERHEHGKKVGYVPEGKDAAVAYGSIDFKFKNNLDNDVKLYFSTDDSTLSVRINKIS